MELKIDLKDRKIMYLLLEDAGLSPAFIGKHVGLSKNAVLYRIRRLASEGVIRGFLPIVNHDFVGIESYNIFLKFRATAEQEERIKDYFRKQGNVVWAVSLFGKWDMLVQILAWNMAEFTAMLKDILGYLGPRLDCYEVKTLLERPKIELQLFDYAKETGFTFRKQAPKQPLELDEFDKRILAYMNERAMPCTYQEIGKAAGVTMETARNRVKAMLEKGAIHKQMIWASHPKLGLEQYLVFLTLRYTTPEKERELMTYLHSNRKVKIIFRELGKLELYFFVAVESTKEFERLFKEIKSRFFEMILEADHMYITEEIVLNYFPPGLLKGKQ
jgi:DNA-binding Lrp family transcriptional regulator